MVTIPRKELEELCWYRRKYRNEKQERARERDNIEREWRRLDLERHRMARKRLVEEEKENSNMKGGTKESTNETTKECKKVPKKKILKLVKKN